MLVTKDKFREHNWSVALTFWHVTWFWFRVVLSLLLLWGKVHGGSLNSLFTSSFSTDHVRIAQRQRKETHWVRIFVIIGLCLGLWCGSWIVVQVLPPSPRNHCRRSFRPGTCLQSFSILAYCLFICVVVGFRAAQAKVSSNTGWVICMLWFLFPLTFLYGRVGNVEEVARYAFKQLCDFHS